MKLRDIFWNPKRKIPGEIIHSSADEFGNLLVIEYPRYRALSFDSVYEQSAYDVLKPYSLVHEYTRIMMLVIGMTEPRHATLLGLGGGSLLRSLHHCLSHCRFHVVELRPKVLYIAKRYFDIPVDERVQVTIGDASDALETMPDAGTDVIFSDIYDAHRMHSLQQQRHFVDECWRGLSADGWLVINYHRLPDFDSAFFARLNRRFGKIMVCSGKLSNHILFAGKSGEVDIAAAPARLRMMEERLNDRFVPLLRRLKPVQIPDIRMDED